MFKVTLPLLSKFSRIGSLVVLAYEIELQIVVLFFWGGQILFSTI